MQVILDDLIINGKFKDGARGPIEFDCWGLASEVLRRYGIDVPDYKISCEAATAVDAQVRVEKILWVKVDNRQSPSLIVFSDRGLCCHVGVYLGRGKFIHAYEKTGVSITSVDHSFWKSRIEGFYLPRWAYAEHSVIEEPNTTGSP